MTEPDEPGDYDAEAVLVLDDWLDGVTGRHPEQVLARLRGKGMSMHGMGGHHGGPGPASPLGADTGGVQYPYYLINGRTNSDPISVRAKPGQRLRLRLINAGGDTAFRVALGGHRLTATHSDGFATEPAEGDGVLLAMDERYDVVATLSDGMFPLVAAPEGKQGRALAIVRTASGTAPALRRSS